MSHSLTSRDGAAYAKFGPWHSKGHTFADHDTLDAREASQATGSYWDPVLCPLKALGVGPLDGSDVLVPTEPEVLLDLDGNKVANASPAFRAVRRPDTGEVLSVVGANYVPFGPKAMADLLSEAGLRVGSFLTLRGGRDVVASIPGQPFTIRTQAGADTLQAWTILADNTVGQRRFYALLNTNRVDCANMLATALSHDRTQWSFKHTERSLTWNLGVLRDVLASGQQAEQQAAQRLQALADKVLSAQQRRNYWLQVFTAASKKKVPTVVTTDKEAEALKEAEAFLATLQEHLDAEDTAKAGRGSAFGALQAVTRWTTHSRTARRGQQGSTVEEARLVSNLLGTAQEVAAASLELALAL